MKKYIYRGILFAIPIIILYGFIVVIDPYEFINIFHVLSAEKKVRVLNRNDEAGPRGNMLWKVVHYRRNPVKNILIGDSQCRRISEEQLKELTGEAWFNFCIPGASYETMFDNFWFAARETDLQKVYFEVSFMNYNKNRSYSITRFAWDYIENPYLYFTKKEIFLDSWINFKYGITGNESLVEQSHEYEKLELMNEIAEKRMQLFFTEYAYPHEFYEELKQITNYCKENNIELVYLIMPTYEGVHEHLENIGLMEMYERFKQDIRSLGETYDYDVGLEVSKHRENFTDYFHPRENVLNQMTRSIWGPDPVPDGVRHSNF